MIGDILPNGAILLEKHRRDAESSFVLAYWAGNPQPYVVWTMDKDRHTFWGHYFDKLSDAALYLERRAS